MLLFHLDMLYAQIIDRIEVQRKGNAAEIRLSFSTQVQYLRHAPLDEGKLLRVFIQLTGDVRETELVEQRMSSPKTDLIPNFKLIYPDLAGAIEISFDRPTTFTVGQGQDSKSILISVPVAPGAQDWMAEYRPTPEELALSAVKPSVPPAPAVSIAQTDTSIKSSAPPGRNVVAVVIEPSPPAPTAAAAPPAQDSEAPRAADIPRAPAVPPPTKTAEQLPVPIQIAASGDVRTDNLPTLPADAAIVSPAAAAEQQSANKPTRPPKPATANPEVVLKSLPSLADSLPPDGSRPPGLASDEIERQAQLFMEDGRQLIGTRNGVEAVFKLRQVLDLPRNSQTEYAQALIGEARELSGELSRARVEYEIYMKQYPNGRLAPQVKEKLTQLNKLFASGAAGTGPGGKRQQGNTDWMINGGISQYYYFGNSEIEVITPPPPGQLTFAVDRLSLIDQRALISNIDLNARKRADGYDTRIVFRDSETNNYLPNQPNRSRLNAAYVEQSNQELGYMARAGRQTGSSGGVLGRFDGLLAGYNIDSDWRVNGVLGYPVEYNSPYQRTMFGTSVDFLPQMDRVGVTGYYIQQSVNGVTDRQAVGLESRFFNTFASLYGMLDYDLGFKGLNILMLQGNLRTAEGTSYFTSLDHRRTPLLSVINALPGYAFQTIQSLNEQLGLTELRSSATNLTGWSNMFSIGATHPLSNQWQVGTDYRVVNMSGTPGAGDVPAQPGIKNSHVVSLQAIGNKLMADNDIFVTNASRILAPTYNGKNLALTYSLPFAELWRFDLNVNYYSQLDNQEQQQDRLSPSLRVSYRWSNSTSLEMSAGGEDVKESGPLRNMTSKRKYMYGGYRYDFR